MPRTPKIGILARLPLVAGALGLLALGACSKGIEQHTIPAPSSALDFAVVGPKSLAVLAGKPRSRGVFFLDLGDGAVTKSFGVTSEASSLIANTDGGVVLGIRANERGKSIGAVEFWSANGRKLDVVGMPSGVTDLTEMVDGHFYALVGPRTSRAAVELDAVHHVISGSFPLAGDVTKIALCRFELRNYLLEEKSAGGFLVRDLVDRTKEIAVRDTVTGPACGTHLGVVYAISDALGSKALAIFKWPSPFRAGSLPVSVNTTRLRETPDGGIATLTSARSVSSIDIFPPTAITAHIADKASSGS